MPGFNFKKPVQPEIRVNGPYRTLLVPTECQEDVVQMQDILNEMHERGYDFLQLGMTAPHGHEAVLVFKKRPSPTQEPPTER